MNGIERWLPTVPSAPLVWTRPEQALLHLRAWRSRTHCVLFAATVPSLCPRNCDAVARPLHLLENLDPDCGPIGAHAGLERVPDVAGRPLQPSLCFRLIAALTGKKLYDRVVLQSSV